MPDPIFGMPTPILIGPLVPLLMPNPNLEVRLRPIASRWSAGGIAVVDLDPTALVPGLASFRGQQQFYVASVAKLAVMVSAFLLREHLTAFGLSNNDIRASDLISKFDAVHRRSISSRFSASPDFPALSNIFSISDRASTTATWSIAFRRDQPPPGNPNPGTKISPRVGFADRLALMIGVSNNDAASRCIRDIGFQYIHGAMEDLGLYKPKQGGIWLGKSFDGTTAWKFPPNGGIQAANAEALAVLLTSVARGRLVNASASAEMARLMAQSGSFIGEALKGGSPPPTQVEFAKDGFDQGITSDVAICRKATGARYGAIIVGMPNQSVFNAVALALDGLF
jgi:beta-lactamase family protein